MKYAFLFVLLLSGCSRDIEQKHVSITVMEPQKKVMCVRKPDAATVSIHECSGQKWGI